MPLPPVEHDDLNHLVEFEGRGLLFGDATNIMVAQDGEDVFGTTGIQSAGESMPEKKRRGKAATDTAKAKTKGKTEVGQRPRSRSTGPATRARKTRVEVVMDAKASRTLRRTASTKSLAVK